jgi:16S rRNA (uracil1498-N3)-methyltransferase
VVIVAISSRGPRVTVNLLVTPVELERAELIVDGDAYRHLFRAARTATGDPVRVVDGCGRARQGEVVSIDRRRAVVRLGAAAAALEPRLALELLVAAPRPSRASWLVEKGTELGVRAFRFLECERSERRLDDADLDRLRRVARAAVEQCGRSLLPEITGAHELAAALGAHGGTHALLLHPEATVRIGDLDPTARAPSAVVVGPEGGLTAAEIELAIRLGATPVRLVAPTLRVETAALAASAWALISADPL